MAGGQKTNRSGINIDMDYENSYQLDYQKE